MATPPFPKTREEFKANERALTYYEPRKFGISGLPGSNEEYRTPLEAVELAIAVADAKQQTVVLSADGEILFTARPLSLFAPDPLPEGFRVSVPPYLYRPTCYDEAGDFPAVVGTVVESHGHLVAVKFDLYPNTVDYTVAEAALFGILEFPE